MPLQNAAFRDPWVESGVESGDIRVEKKSIRSSVFSVYVAFLAGKTFVMHILKKKKKNKLLKSIPVIDAYTCFLCRDCWRSR